MTFQQDRQRAYHVDESDWVDLFSAPQAGGICRVDTGAEIALLGLVVRSTISSCVFLSKPR